jgi:hypothetical protein
MRSATKFQLGSRLEACGPILTTGIAGILPAPGTILVARNNKTHGYKFMKFKGLSSV